MESRSTSARSRRGSTVKQRTLRIGVIADTHGLYDLAIEPHFTGMDEILHAGDIGGIAVIRLLQRLAPVTAVSGNVDDYEASGFARPRLLRRGGITIAVCHALYEKGKMNLQTQAWLNREEPDVCVFGHSHRPMVGQFGPTLLFNPGSAGPKRFSLPRGIGMLTIEGGKARPELIRLKDSALRNLHLKEVSPNDSERDRLRGLSEIF